MADPTQANALRAMRKAYDAGDMESARRMARLAKSLGDEGTQPRDGNGFMGQLNAGIADTAGGLVDFINPLDDLGVTGSAREGLRSGMEAIGAAVADDEPDGVVQGLGRGTGNAVAAFAPTVKGLQSLRSVGGAIGAAADDAYRALTSVGGAATEAVAGATAGGAREAAESAGAPEWAQNVAEVAVPAVGLPAATGAARGAVRGTGRMVEAAPLTGAAVRVGRDVKRGLFPMTEGGAREVARDRLHTLAGGEERANALGRSIRVDEDLNRTPAQQTGDPNLLGLERSAANESPVLRERLDARRDGSRETARESIDSMGGDVSETRDFFDSRLRQFRSDIQGRVDEAISRADTGLDATAPRRSESDNSLQAVGRIKRELDTQLMREADLWNAVPRGAAVGTGNVRSAYQEIAQSIPKAQREDLPGVASRLLGDGDDAFADRESVNELHGLYSKLRQVARTAMSGSDQNKNRARIANELADAVLSDLEAVPQTSEIGRAINEARAFSRALHETFDQGAVGRILKRTIDGDETMTPEAALRRTVGRGGASGMADDAGLRRAAPEAAEDVSDYFRGRFSDAVRSATGEFTPKAAFKWLRDNRETLSRYPGLEAELRKAATNRQAADHLAARTKIRQGAADGSAIARFNRGQDTDAIRSILSADSPAKAARSITASARKDESGKALAGVKAAFSDYLIDGAMKRDGLSGPELSALLKDPKTRGAMRQVFNEAELKRLNTIADQLASLDVSAKDVGSVMDSPANKLVEYVVRIVAARQGGQMGGGTMGGSLQTANIFVERAQNMLRNLTNDKARQLLMDAVEDPALFRTLMLEPKGVDLPKEARNRLAPYLTGAAANATTDDEPR